jgi:hypothetical protein
MTKGCFQDYLEVIVVTAKARIIAADIVQILPEFRADCRLGSS